MPDMPPIPRDCSCAMTEESMRSCTVHGENPNKYGLYEGFDPFYENRDTLLDFLSDEVQVPVATVMRWVTMTPAESLAGESDAMDPDLVIRFEHLPRILQVFSEMMREQNQTGEHTRITLKYPGRVELGITAIQIKMVLDYACAKANMDIIQLLRHLANPEGN